MSYRNLLEKNNFTNGTNEHAKNVLSKVGVFEEIDDIFDIKDANYIPKPELLPYKKLLKSLKLFPIMRS